jgi:hypothetical protein
METALRKVMIHKAGFCAVTARYEQFARKNGGEIVVFPITCGTPQHPYNFWRVKA